MTDANGAGASPRTARLLTLLLGLAGIALAAVGLLLDWLLPHTTPGLNLPQLLVIGLGLALTLSAVWLHKHGMPARFRGLTRRQLLKAGFISLLTLLALELALTAIGFGTYYPAEIPQRWIERVDWLVCDADGCRYVPERMRDQCDDGALSGRDCMLNRLGYHDRKDFTAAAAMGKSPRILMLGDSFTAGFSAGIGQSFAELIEARYANGVVWNTAIGGKGTNHALASFRKWSPELQPHIAILGFVMNDYDDNVLPLDSYYVGVDLRSDRPVLVRQYQIDLWGNVVKLDEQRALYFFRSGVEPPATEWHYRAGTTRLGSLALRTAHALGEQLVADARFNRKVDITREYLQGLRDAAAARGTALLAVLVPELSHIDQPSQRYSTSRQLMRQLAIPFVDPFDALDAADYAPLPDGHWNGRGHGIVAALLIDCIDAFVADGNFADCAAVTAGG